MNSRTNLLLAGGLAFLVGGAAMAEEAGPASAPAVRTLEISVTEDGFEPTPIKVKKDEPLKLVVTRKTQATCAKKLVLDEANVSVDLPLNKPVEVLFTPKKSGRVKYGCQMGKMISGILIVE